MNIASTRGIAVQARRGAASLLALLPMALLLAACGGGKVEIPAGEVAARVNGEPIGSAQIAGVLQMQRGIRPEQVDTVGKAALERLIDQQLAAQKALEQKLEQDPKVVAQIEFARREVLARAYVEKVGDGVTKPTAEAVKQYYDEKPALFKERRIYNIQELAIEARPEQVEILRAELGKSLNINTFVEYLKANSIRFAANQAVRPAEQLPLNMLDAFAKLKDGQAALVPTPTGAQVIVLAGSRLEPVDEAHARPAIEQFLIADAKRKRVEADLKALRTAAKIEYTAAASAPAATAPAASAASGAK